MYGITHGNNQYGGQELNSSPQKTQEDLAADMDMDVRTLRNYKLLADMIPELEELLDVEKSVINNLLKIDVFYCKIKIITYCEVI